MRKLQQGQIVLYQHPITKSRYPAIITVVCGVDVVDLFVISSIDTAFIHEVIQGNEPSQWQWPDMVE